MLSSDRIVVPEVEIFLGVLLVTFLYDQNDFQKAFLLSFNLLSKVKELNRRTLDVLAAKLFFYYSVCHSCIGSFSDIQKY